MSCGSPHEVDCQEVLAAVYTFLDDEADDATCAKVRQHLDECAPCLARFGVEQRLKELIHRSCGCDPVPDELRVRVVTAIRSVTVRLDPVDPTA